MAVQYHAMMSVDEYLELDRNSSDVHYEYLDGQVWMLASGTPDHAYIAANVIATMHSLLADSPCRIYTSDVQVYLSKTRYVHPDITVSCDKQDHKRGDMLHAPRVVVEVLSPTTETQDRGRKLWYYRACPSIQEYMLVNTQQPLIELFRRERGDLWTYRTFELEDDVVLASLDIRFAVSKIYGNIEWTQENDEL